MKLRSIKVEVWSVNGCLPYLCTPQQKIFFRKAQLNVATYVFRKQLRDEVCNFLYQESVSLCDSKKYKSSMWKLIQRPFLDNSCLKSVLHNSSVPLLQCIQTLEQTPFTNDDFVWTSDCPPSARTGHLSCWASSPPHAPRCRRPAGRDRAGG